MDISEYLLILVFVLAIYIVSQREIKETFENDAPVCDGKYVIEIPNFLTHEECDDLIDAAMKQGLVDSEVAGFTEKDPAKLELESRRSKQTWFSPGAHSVTDTIQKKTKDFLNTKKSCIDKYQFEDVQVARYTKGGYYLHHYDGDDCDDSCPKDQRLATLIVYLHEPKKGGQTDFPNLNTAITPKKGNAVFFWVADPKTRKLYEQTLHAGMPILEGVKIIATQWVRSI
jgi:prolyl 4-hydroxylase